MLLMVVHSVEFIKSCFLSISHPYMTDIIVLLIPVTLRQSFTGYLLLRCHLFGNFEQLDTITVADRPA